MDEADKMADRIQDTLYLAGVRADENVHLDVNVSQARDLVSVRIYPNHLRCIDCRSEGLIRTMVDTMRKKPKGHCTGCQAQTETNGFHIRAKMASVIETLGPGYTVTDRDVFSVSGYLYFKV